MYVFLRVLRMLSGMFLNDTAITEIYTLSLHDALPISLPWDGPGGARCGVQQHGRRRPGQAGRVRRGLDEAQPGDPHRSEEHTSELQSRVDLVCRLLLEKKKAKRPSGPRNDLRATR